MLGTTYVYFVNICESIGDWVEYCKDGILNLELNIAQTRFCDGEFCWAATPETIFIGFIITSCLNVKTSDSSLISVNCEP